MLKIKKLVLGVIPFLFFFISDQIKCGPIWFKFYLSDIMPAEQYKICILQGLVSAVVNPLSKIRNS